MLSVYFKIVAISHNLQRLLPRIAGPHAAAREPKLRAILPGTRSSFSRRVRRRYRQTGNRESPNVEEILLSSFACWTSVFPAILLHGRVRSVQTRWYATRLRGRPAVIGSGTATRGHHPREDYEIWTGRHLQARMHYYRVPECVLLYGQHRWSEGEDAVIIFFFSIVTLHRSHAKTYARRFKVFLWHLLDILCYLDLFFEFKRE